MIYEREIKNKIDKFKTYNYNLKNSVIELKEKNENTQIKQQKIIDE